MHFTEKHITQLTPELSVIMEVRLGVLHKSFSSSTPKVSIFTLDNHSSTFTGKTKQRGHYMSINQKVYQNLIHVPITCIRSLNFISEVGTSLKRKSALGSQLNRKLFQLGRS